MPKFELVSREEAKMTSSWAGYGQPDPGPGPLPESSANEYVTPCSDCGTLPRFLEPYPNEPRSTVMCSLTIVPCRQVKSRCWAEDN